MLRYDKYMFFLTYQVCMHEYKIRHTLLHMKMVGWMLLEAAQTSLSNLLLLAVGYGIMFHFSRIALTLVSCEPNEYACVEQNAKKTKKKCNTIVLLEHALDCCACGIELNAPCVYLRLSDYRPRTLSNATGARGQYRCNPGLVGGPRSTKGRNTAVVPGIIPLET